MNMDMGGHFSSKFYHMEKITDENGISSDAKMKSKQENQKFKQEQMCNY